MAQAILLKDVENVGERGDVIDVSPGYLRNYLLPRKLAQSATAASIAEAKRRMEAQERAARELADDAGSKAYVNTPRPEDKAQRRVHRSETYGRRPSSRARFIARASWRWWRRQDPVIRAERILPFSLIARRSVGKSL